MNAEKKATLTEYLARGLTKVIIDSRQQGVDVPDAQRNSHLALHLSHRFADPVHVTDWGVRCVLSFNGVNAPVAFPWHCLFIMIGQGEHAAQWDRPTEPPVLTKRRGILGLVN